MARLPLLLILLASALPLLSACRAASTAPSAPPTVTIRGRTWTVELATTPDQRYQGLSDRDALADKTGMLFIYPQPQDMAFCMRRCLIPLDIAFMDGNRQIVRIYTMKVEPYGDERYTYPSGAPAQYVLETTAGDFLRAGIHEGDQAEFSNSVPAAAKAQSDP